MENYLLNCDLHTPLITSVSASIFTSTSTSTSTSSSSSSPSSSSSAASPLRTQDTCHVQAKWQSRTRPAERTHHPPRHFTCFSRQNQPLGTLTAGSNYTYLHWFIVTALNVSAACLVRQLFLSWAVAQDWLTTCGCPGDPGGSCANITTKIAASRDFHLFIWAWARVCFYTGCRQGLSVHPCLSVRASHAAFWGCWSKQDCSASRFFCPQWCSVHGPHQHFLMSRNTFPQAPMWQLRFPFKIMMSWSLLHKLGVLDGFVKLSGFQLMHLRWSAVAYLQNLDIPWPIQSTRINLLNRSHISEVDSCCKRNLYFICFMVWVCCHIQTQRPWRDSSWQRETSRWVPALHSYLTVSRCPWKKLPNQKHEKYVKRYG